MLNVDAAGLNRFTCVKSRMEDYASELKTNRVGDGNAKNFDEFIKGKDRYGNPVKVKKILSNIYNLGFLPISKIHFWLKHISPF